MQLHADDDIHRARMVYLGPPKYPLPVHLPYVEWGLYVALTAVFALLGWLVTGAALTSLSVALGAAMPATSYIWGHTTADVRIRHVIAAWLSAAVTWHTNRRRAAAEGRLPRLTARKVRIDAGPPADQEGPKP